MRSLQSYQVMRIGTYRHLILEFTTSFLAMTV